MIDTTDKCEKCGGQMVVILASNPARSECKTCGHHVDFLWDPALPDDCYKQLDSILTIDHFQSVDERNRVALELRTLLGISPTEAMRLVRALPINIDWPFERGMWRLIDWSAPGFPVQSRTENAANNGMHTKPSIGRFDSR